ncbi:MAG: imidazole glycerol phosphate synthase subunit HisH [Rhodospirillaceae bacterium]|nr:imidazole glycerol phosphate synthase subunit HisH [Rhodospirillaceae bacterium]
MSVSPVIIASGGANLASLKFALGRLGVEAPVTEDGALVEAASHVILPGVGAARDAMTRLHAAGLVEVIRRLEQPVLGICLGLQLLYSGSDEDQSACLDIIPGWAKRFESAEDRPVPQMGWNSLHRVTDCPLIDGIEDGDYAYFIHSYALPPGPGTCATSDYGGAFSAVVQQANFFATQFHPERSARVGTRVLSNFLQL